MILLDTSILIDYQRNFKPCVDWMESCDEVLMISGYTAYELINTARNRKELEASIDIAELYDRVWPTNDDRVRGYESFSQMKLAQGMGIIDALIAATAVGYNAPLATFNLEHFKNYPGLTTIQPYLQNQ